jgi:hypothetical protein
LQTVFQAAEAEAGLAAGFVGRHAGADVLLLLHFEVEAELVVEIGVEPALAEESGQSG